MNSAPVWPEARLAFYQRVADNTSSSHLGIARYAESEKNAPDSFLIQGQNILTAWERLRLGEVYESLRYLQITENICIELISTQNFGWPERGTLSPHIHPRGKRRAVD